MTIHTNLQPGFAGAFATVGIDGDQERRPRGAPVREAPHLHGRHHPPAVRRPARLAQRLHHARRGGPLRRRGGGRDRKRPREGLGRARRAPARGGDRVGRATSASSSRRTDGRRRSPRRARSSREAPEPRRRGGARRGALPRGRIDEAGEALAALASRRGRSGAGAGPARPRPRGAGKGRRGRGADGARGRQRAAGSVGRLPPSGAAAPARAPIELLSTYLETAPGDDPDRRRRARGDDPPLHALWASGRSGFPVAVPSRLEVPLKPLAGTGGGYFVEAALANGKKIRLPPRHGEHRAVRRGARGQEGRIHAALRQRPSSRAAATGRTSSSRGLLAEARDRRTGVRGRADHDDRRTSSIPQGRIHGVLGLNVFSGYRVTLDLANEPADPRALRATTGRGALLGRRRADARPRVRGRRTTTGSSSSTPARRAR